MRLLAAALVIGSLTIGALPAAAGESTAVREAYTLKARDDVQAWRHKLYYVGGRPAVEDRAAGNALETELNEAWIKAAAASRRLQLTGINGWESTQSSFEKAHHELAAAWRKVHPEDK